MAQIDKTDTPSTDISSARAIAVRGITYAPPAKAGSTGLAEIRVEPGAEIPETIPADVVAALVKEGSAKR